MTVTAALQAKLERLVGLTETHAIATAGAARAAEPDLAEVEVRLSDCAMAHSAACLAAAAIVSDVPGSALALTARAQAADAGRFYLDAMSARCQAWARARTNRATSAKEDRQS